MMNGRRALTMAVLACAAGAGLAFVGAGRTWEQGYTHNVSPLPPSSFDQTGSDLVPGLSALALVALAGAGALLATRGIARRVVGVLVTLVGLALVVLAVGRVDASTAWPAFTAVGGALVVVAGVAAVLVGHRWPAMSARYERTPGARRVGGTTDTWNALDRGEDPTATGEPPVR